MKKTILVTGGIGYIGSHAILKLLKENLDIIIIDNLSNSKKTILEGIQSISSRDLVFYEGDIRNRTLLKKIFTQHPIDSVIHLSGLKSIYESEIKPHLYYDNNVNGSIVLLEEMLAANVYKIVFSSSAAVYGETNLTQYHEGLLTNPINVYGRTKFMVEKIINDLSASNPSFKAVCLRIFNPAGAHHSGLIGDSPLGTPKNLIPCISQVALGRLPFLKIYGGEYQTPDGTGMRDYVHVDDLANGFYLALKYLENNQGVLTVNLGNEEPYSVLEIISAFEKASDIKIPYQFVEKRPGDLPIYFANAQMAKKILNWTSTHSLYRMCSDAWHFYK